MPLTFGSWGLIHDTSLLALIPMLMFLVFAFMPKKIPGVLNPILCCIVGCIICGVGPKQFGEEIAYACNTTVGKVGLLLMVGCAVGVQMEQCKVTTTLCTWIVKGMHVNSTKKAIITVTLCEFVCATLLGSMSTAISAIAPILIPIAASCGLSACALSSLVQTVGEAGMIISPTSGPVLALLTITGLTYKEYFVWGALPFALIFIISIVAVTPYINKKFGANEMYDAAQYAPSEAAPTKREAFSTIMFLIAFVGLVGYSVITNAGMDFILTAMLILFALLTICGGINLKDTTNNLVKGMASGMSSFLVCIFYQFMADLIDLGGGFTALSDLFSHVTTSGASSTLLLGTLIGTFAVSGGAAAQIKIIHGMFEPMLLAAGVPMTLWMMGLICGHRATNNIYPCTNMIIPMGLCHTENMKAQLFGCWFSAFVAVIICVIWSFVGPMLFM